MGNFDRSRRQGGHSGSRGPRQMHKAVCGDCGKDCEVPFKPSSDKPIYCSRCFEKHDDKRGGRNSRSSGGFSGGRDRGGRTGRDRPMHRAKCDKCGMGCEVPFKPTGDKPIYCDNCFGKGDARGRSSRDSMSHSDIEAKLSEMDGKIDQILKALKPLIPVVEEVDEIEDDSTDESVMSEAPAIEERKTVTFKKRKTFRATDKVEKIKLK